MFLAKVDDGNESERARLVRLHIARLENRIESLERKRTRLRRSTGDDSVTPAERARAARLAARATAIERGINRTERAATRAGIAINRSKLDMLRQAVRELTGPKVAGIPITVVDVDRRGRSGEHHGSDRGEKNGRGQDDSLRQAAVESTNPAPSVELKDRITTSTGG